MDLKMKYESVYYWCDKRRSDRENDGEPIHLTKGFTMINIFRNQFCQPVSRLNIMYKVIQIHL